MGDTTYQGYLAAVKGVSQPQDRLRVGQQQNDETHRRAVELADSATARAQEQVAAGMTQIETELGRARSLLGRVGLESLVPPRIRASAVPAKATTNDVSSALSDLTSSVDALVPLVSAEESRRAADEDRRRRELEELRARDEAARRAAEAAALRRRSRQRALVLALVGIVLVAAVVFVLALLH